MSHEHYMPRVTVTSPNYPGYAWEVEASDCANQDALARLASIATNPSRLMACALYLAADYHLGGSSREDYEQMAGVVADSARALAELACEVRSLAEADETVEEDNYIAYALAGELRECASLPAVLAAIEAEGHEPEPSEVVDGSTTGVVYLRYAWVSWTHDHAHGTTVADAHDADVECARLDAQGWLYELLTTDRSHGGSIWAVDPE